MDCLPKSLLLEFHTDTLNHVRKLHGLDEPGEMKKLIDQLEDWVQNQDNFVKKDFHRHYLENTIIGCKGSLERAKTRLLKICTYRTEMSHLFGNFDIKNDFKEFDDVIFQAFLPKLTKDYCRVFLIRNIGKKFQPSITLQFIRIAVMMLDYLKCNDYSDGLIFVVDLSEVSMLELIAKVSLSDIRYAAKVIIQAYGTRVKGIHIVSSSRIINFLTWLIKQVVSMKIISRLYVHPNIKSLPNFIPVDLLPEDYGGNERSLKSLHNDWIEMMASQEFRSYMEEMTSARLKEPNHSKIVNGIDTNID